MLCLYLFIYVWYLLIQFSQFSPRCASLWMPPSPSVLELLCLIPCTCTVTRCGHVPLGMGIIWHHGLRPARACRTVPGGGLGDGQVGRAVWWEQVEYQEPNLQGHYGHLIWQHLNTSESGCTESQVPVVSTVLTCLDHFLQQLVRRCSKWVVVKDQPALHSSCWMLNKRSKGMPGCPAARCRMWFLCTVTHGSWFNLLRQILGIGCALDGLRFGMCEESRLMRACGRCVLKLVKKTLKVAKIFQDIPRHSKTIGLGDCILLPGMGETVSRVSMYMPQAPAWRLTGSIAMWTFMWTQASWLGAWGVAGGRLPLRYRGTSVDNLLSLFLFQMIVRDPAKGCKRFVLLVALVCSREF